MVVNYNNGKIYKIYRYGIDEIYIGSTCISLSQRLAKHRQDYNEFLSGKRNYTSSYELVKHNDCKIELIEEYSCENMEQLRKKEGYYIRNIENCINRRIAGRTKREYYEENLDKFKENGKKYREENADKIKEKEKKYREENADRIKEKEKKYREENADRIKENSKKYYKENADRVKEKKRKYREENSDYFKEKNRIKINCEICNCIITKCNIRQHERTLKHQNNLKRQEMRNHNY